MVVKLFACYRTAWHTQVEHFLLSTGDIASCTPFKSAKSQPYIPDLNHIL